MKLTTYLEPYRVLDPERWVATYRLLPAWMGLLLLLVGVVLLGWGGGRALRLTAALSTAALVWILAPSVGRGLGLEFSADKLALLTSIGFGALAAALPPAGLFMVTGLPLGLLSGQLAGQLDWIWGFLPVFVGMGTLGALFYRILGAVIGSLVGGWAVVLGFLAGFHQVSLIDAFAENKLAVLISAAVLAFAGGLYQLVFTPSPEEQQERKARLQAERQAAAERAAIHKRWYGDGTGE